MIILEYKLQADKQSPAGVSCPDWVDDGGHWPGTDNTLIGITRDNPIFYIPSNVNILSALELEERQLLIHGNKPMLDDSSGIVIELDEAGVRAKIQEWIALKTSQQFS